MPPILHPRSRQTASLFSATLLASFFVVGLPHILPCPVNPRAANDSGDALDDQGPQKRRRRRRCGPEEQMATRQIAAGEEAPASACSPDEVEPGFEKAARRRECPVPKPGGLVGQILGFENQDRVRRTVIVESVRARRTGQTKENDES